MARDEHPGGPVGMPGREKATSLNSMLDGWRRCAMSANSLFPVLGQFLGAERGPGVSLSSHVQRAAIARAAGGERITSTRGLQPAPSLPGRGRLAALGLCPRGTEERPHSDSRQRHRRGKGLCLGLVHPCSAGTEAAPAQTQQGWTNGSSEPLSPRLRAPRAHACLRS